MFYLNLKFPKLKDRPFFYTNFVQTVDGKVSVKKSGYWPIGSRKDHVVLTELRAYADCLIHGSNLAREFGKVTLDSLNKRAFKNLRIRLGKGDDLPYYVITTKPESFNKYRGVNVFHPRGGSLTKFVEGLRDKGYQHILVEGGPRLLGSFLKEGLIGEIFLTIAPKIYGSQNLTTLNLVEGILFPPDKVKKLKLLSVKKIKDELFLRYRLV